MPDRLHALIHAMTPAEKRRFSLHHGEKAPVSQALFDALAGESSYREKDFLAKHHRAVFCRHYRSHKHTLYTMLLRSLREGQHSGSRRSLTEGLLNVELLAAKGLARDAKRLIKKGLAEAMERGDLEAEYAYRDWAYRLSKAQFFADQTAAEREAMFAATRACRERIAQRDRLREIHMQVYTIMQGTGLVTASDDRAALEVLLAEAEQVPQPSSPSEGENNASNRMLQWQIRYLVKLGFGDAAGQIECIEALLALSEANPQLIQDRPDWTISLLNNQLILLRKFRRFGDTEAVYKRLSKLKIDSPHLQAQRISALALNRFNQVVETGDRQGLEAWMASFPRELARNKQYIQQPLQLLFSYSQAYGAYLMGDLESAAAHLHAYRQMPGQDQRRTISRAIRMIQAIVHAELGHTRLVDSLVRSGLRVLQRESASAPVELLVMRMLRHNQPGIPSRRTWLEALQELESTLLAGDEAYQHRARTGFDLLAWIRAQRDGKPMLAHIAQLGMEYDELRRPSGESPVPTE